MWNYKRSKKIVEAADAWDVLSSPKFEWLGSFKETLKKADFSDPNKMPTVFTMAQLVKYATQIKKRPPTFAVFTNHPKPLEGSYHRYLINSLREYFALNLTPIRLYFRKSDNPFAERQEKTFSKKLHKPKK